MNTFWKGKKRDVLARIVQSASGLKSITLPVLCHANVTFPLDDIQVFGTGWEDSMLLHIFDWL